MGARPQRVRPVDAICIYRVREMRICRDQERQLASPGDVCEVPRDPLTILGTEVAINDTPAARQDFGCGNGIGHAFRIGQQEDRGQIHWEVSLRLSRRLEQLAMKAGLRFLRHHDD